MFRRRFISSIRLEVLAWLLASLIFHAQAAGVSSIALQGSIKRVEEAPATGPIDPHKPFITRHTLKSDEVAATMDFEVALKLRNFAELQARVARGEHISPAEMAAKYAPLASDYQSVVSWLNGQGFTITQQDSGRLAVSANGNIGQIAQALQVSFARVSLEGQEYTSAISAPSVPATLSPLLIGINGLQPHIHMHTHLVIRPGSTTSTSPPYIPSQLAQAYSATGLYSSGITGTGQTIAIAINTFPKTSDLTNFWTTCKVSQSLSNITFIQVVSGHLPSPTGEETLDTEWSSSIAPGAKVRVYASRSLSFTGLDAVYGRIYNDVSTYGINQMSMSYGATEVDEQPSQIVTDEGYFMELTAAGVTLFASAGDVGATPSSSEGVGTSLSTEDPAADPYVTGVGGTSLTLDSNGNESGEVVWNDGDNGVQGDGATGGGEDVPFTYNNSSYFSQPGWQMGPTVPTGTMRLVPDVALSADTFNGGLIVLNGAQETIGGTSWGSPTWAAFCALINQERAAAKLPSLGLLGPYIYPLIGTSNFRDITSGNNIYGSGNPGYYAGTGYDMCTGVGVPLMQTLAQTLSEVAPQISNGPPPTTGTINVAYSFTYQATGNPAPTFSVPPNMLPPGLSLSSAGVISGTPTATGIFTGTVSASNGVTPNAMQDFTITIQQAPTITNGPPPATVLVNSAYNFAYTASGYPVPTFSVTPNTLPPGLSLSSAGVISGSPMATGIFTGTVDAGNTVMPDATQSFSITVQEAAAITNGPLPTSIQDGSVYNFAFTASGYPAPTYSVSSGALPLGLTLSSDGVISGTATTPGTYTGTIDASNGASSDATQNFSITVEQAQVADDEGDSSPTMPPGGLILLASLLLFFGARQKVREG